jgi:hypothetical protein
VRIRADFSMILRRLWNNSGDNFGMILGTIFRENFGMILGQFRADSGFYFGTEFEANFGPNFEANFRNNF